MKRVVGIMIVLAVCLNVVPAFAGASSCGTKGAAKGAATATPVAKESLFQKCSDKVNTWDATKDVSRQSSLRGNKAEICKRRGIQVE